MSYLDPADYLGGTEHQPTPSEIYAPGAERRAELKAMGYDAYLQTPEWRELRRQMIGMAEHRCQRCRQRGKPLELHHLTYERLGDELPEDLEVLCQTCHWAEHTKVA